MRIATWNVNGLRARMDFMEIWLDARKPDVVGLQEIKLHAADFPFDRFEALGYQALVHGQKGWNGVAVLSKRPATLVQAGLPGRENDGARLISAQIDDLRFTTVYCPNGKRLDHPDFEMKLDWYDALIDYFRYSSQGPGVLCGDFNIVPAAIDSWRGEQGDGRIFHTDAERARMASLLELPLTDLYRQHEPTGTAYSWWDYRGGSFHRNQGLRIDLMLATAPVADEHPAVTIDRDFRKKHDGLTASDHAPVYTDLPGALPGV